MIISSNEDGSIHIFDTLGGAAVGRWSGENQKPDRCNCYNPETMLHLHAEGYIESPDGCRMGVCRKCIDEMWKSADTGYSLVWYPIKDDRGG